MHFQIKLLRVRPYVFEGFSICFGFSRDLARRFRVQIRKMCKLCNDSLTSVKLQRRRRLFHSLCSKLLFLVMNSIHSKNDHNDSNAEKCHGKH